MVFILVSQSLKTTLSLFIASLVSTITKPFQHFYYMLLELLGLIRLNRYGLGLHAISITKCQQGGSHS